MLEASPPVCGDPGAAARHLAAVASTSATLRVAAAHPHHARKRLHSHMRRAASLAGLWASVQVDARAACAAAELPDTVTVLYGDGGWKSRGSPKLQAYHSAVAHFGEAHVILVDEYLTTKMCADCCGRLQDVMRGRAEGGGGEPRHQAGIKRCASTACAGCMFKGRDLNAARNIFAVFVWLWTLGPGSGRPPYMARSGDTDGEKHRYGKLPVWLRKAAG